MDEGDTTIPTGIDKGVYLDSAITSLASRYTQGFWTWMREERPIEYEIIKHKQERMEHAYTSGTTEHGEDFRYATKSWWRRTARNITAYNQDKEAKEKYGLYV